jgi:WD40 repeat protein
MSESEMSELETLKQRIKELEEECDLLAFDNHRLRQENVKLMALCPPPVPTVEIDVSHLLEEGDGKYVNNVQYTIDNACSGANVICVTFCSQTSDSSKLICCGGANNLINFFKIPINIDDGLHQKIFTYTTSGPILTMDSNRLYPLVCVGSMDGKLYVIDSTQLSNDFIQIFNDHQKYVICTKFSPDGKLLATGSHDKTVHLYKIVADGPSYIIEKLTTIRFENIVESLIFVEKSSENTLVIALRDSLDLVYFNCVTLQKKNVPINISSWDTHRSITPLALSSSPDGNFILVGTDKNMHILYQVGTNKRVRTFAGHSSGQYGKPRVSFSCDGKYIYSNSESENCVYIYSVASEKVEKTLHSHTNIVRDVCTSFTDNSLITCSYDKSVKYWMYQDK